MHLKNRRKIETAAAPFGDRTARVGPGAIIRLGLPPGIIDGWMRIDVEPFFSRCRAPLVYTSTDPMLVSTTPS